MYFTECACGAVLATVATQLRGTCDACDAQCRAEAEQVCEAIRQQTGAHFTVADMWRASDRLTHGPACQCAACVARYGTQETLWWPR